MKGWFKPLDYCMFALIICSTTLEANAADTPTEKSCRSFVQSFYDWYNVTPSKSTEGRGPEDAIKIKRTSFDPALCKTLKADIDAQAKVEGEIVGLDFDPFEATNSDPYKKYVVGKITAKAGTYWADIYGSDGRKKTPKPIVTPEVRFKDNHWQFVNFHYGKSEFPVNENLVSILKVLRESRETPEKK